ncbi:methionine synthase reductase-like [Plakobranchus ocellatus]|uniref:Methionine synthase reductase n=1 Tax=Plakobranchus ocellatus TaxID=259542 RepID=A0AAV3ZJ50_9GAST|nr:methionine synthase reductase-like [Plakobranchus ocellatus]
MLVEKSKQQNRFLLLYGTATGQAKAICEEIAEKAPSFGLFADLFELDDIGKKFNFEKEKCVVIVTSTTGDGDPPPNAEKFMRRIKKRVLSSTYLAHLHYALLGLGDSNYSNFCRCGRDMDARLEALGAHKLYPPGFADDGVGLEIVADPWLKDLYPALQKFLGIHPTTQEPVTETVPCKSHSKANKETDIEGPPEKSFEKLTLSAAGKDGTDGATPNRESKIPVSVIQNSDSLTSNGKSTEKADLVSDSAQDKEKSINVSETSTSIFENGAEGDSHQKEEEDRAEISTDKQTKDPSGAILTDTSAAGANIIRASNRQQVHCSNGACVWSETLCELMRDISQVATIDSSPVLTSNPALSDKDLTVPVLPPAYLDISFCDSSLKLPSLSYQNSCKLPSAASEVFNVAITEAKVLTAVGAVKKTLLLQLSLEGTGIKYSPGDSLSVICPNSSSEVDLLIHRLNLEDVADQAMTLTVKQDTKKRRAAVPAHIHPCNSTLRYVLTTCVSIRDPPSKALIRALVEYTKEDNEIRRLQELCSKEGTQDYTRCLRQSHVSLLDFLCAFPSCLPPVETILEHLPRLQPRPYSACSCQDATPDHLDIVFNLVKVEANPAEGRYYHRRGVCTGWLNDITAPLQRGDKVEEAIQIPVFVRTNQHFRPPADLNQPLIMIGPGTGVAPFIGFLEERRIARQQLEEARNSYGETWLYFGCRNREKDYLFRDRLAEFEKDSTLTQLRVTFSRDICAEEENATGSCSETSISSDGCPPRYVQDQMRRDCADLARLLTEKDALVYVCGDAKNMAADVAAAFEEVLQLEKGMSKDDAHMFIMKKRIHKTYLEDVWL